VENSLGNEGAIDSHQTSATPSPTSILTSALFVIAAINITITSVSVSIFIVIATIISREHYCQHHHYYLPPSPLLLTDHIVPFLSNPLLSASQTLIISLFFLASLLPSA
jgi:hypothetical protein